ncbi:hypothetical protein BJ085DRAFT_30599 [Dimargaris cristalligena]|uniref:Peptide hydrolase n=1 Tax=Dimargaris cristalligena TaxID=215637 RepID=A0A4P9ZW43_9FUNG|nr:hypothetical protein BJ085DRAFT_30599 [Dimargaris cristalligena]|eukprot:RKP37171.1 hypothetical protein BJ085DRAFT_30599 [Dimargaris cristalligena]
MSALQPTEKSGHYQDTAPQTPAARSSDSVTIINEDLLDQKHLRSHLETFYHIAQTTANSRSVRKGFRETADYVFNLLESQKACDTLETQWFKSPVWTEHRPARLSMSYPYWASYQNGVDFKSMRYGGSGSTYLPNSRVIPVRSGGCDPKHYDAEAKGAVVVMQETSACTFWEAAYTAEQVGVAAVLFFGQPSRRRLLNHRIRLVGWKEGDPLVKIPVLAVSYAVGRMLSFTPNARVNIVTSAAISIEKTFNILCQWDAPQVNDTIVIGSHLDSVAAGPGINDNGSGSATTLETLLALRRSGFQPTNRLVFAWWSAEEDGLLGSRHFVRSLHSTPADSDQPTPAPGHLKFSLTWDQISFNLNFDMLASPNYIPMVHRASDAPADVTIGSYFVQKEFETFFQGRGYPYMLSDMKGGSDFVPFMEHGVPTGGILTGAAEIKTEAERKKFGGLANAPLDPCYHQACDTVDNINWEALYRMSEAAAHVIRVFAGADDVRLQA